MVTHGVPFGGEPFDQLWKSCRPLADHKEGRVRTA